ncbi:MAG: isocitrate lyase/phosphoenolpyruvate mutase family protein [bacterium]|nr:isocitrate lyase/phosphoenolpyruvate mutase family protein [bacterium]
MTTQAEKAAAFASLHVKGDPVVLFNIWDAGSAKAVQEAGAKALATGSASVAAAQGYTDGEKVPLDAVLANLRRIAASVDLPLTLDFEGGYAREPEAVAKNVLQVMEAGAVGINFEDQVVGGEGLYPIEEQAARIAAIRRAAEGRGIPFFINARTDIFLKAPAATHSDDHVRQALERAAAYAEAGASGFFPAGVRDPRLIQALCDASPLPVNILVFADLPQPERLARLGVARISYGMSPYRHMMAVLKSATSEALTLQS